MRIGLSCKEPLVGEALACLLENRRGWTPAFLARSVEEAVDRAQSTPISVLLADTIGLEASGFQALVDLNACGATTVVLLAPDSETAASVGGAQLERVVSRRGTSDELFATLDELARPNRTRSSSLPFELSRRELECAQLVARGLSNRRIAELTGLREQSVKNVVSLAMRKMSVENRVQVALRLNQAGVAEVTPTHAVVSISIPDGAAATRS